MRSLLEIASRYLDRDFAELCRREGIAEAVYRTAEDLFRFDVLQNSYAV